MKLYRIRIVPNSRGQVWQVVQIQSGTILAAGTSPADACERVADCKRAQEVASRRYA